ERVAPVAHVALVLRGIRLEVAGRGGRAHLIAVQVKRGFFQAGTVPPGPVSEGDRRGDKFLDVVIALAAALVAGVLGIVIVFVFVPRRVSVAFTGRERAVRRLAVGERENGLTACLARGAPQ